MKRKIIGISGKKQSGKTTASSYICGKLNAIEICLAKPIKDILYVCFGAPNNKLTSQVDKNYKLPCGLYVRQALQKIGTDMFRQLDKECWIRAYKFHLRRYHPNVVIVTPDVRFTNEVEYIQSLGGIVIRLLRTPYDDDHETERNLDTMLVGNYNKLGFDYVIDNRKMTIKEQNSHILYIVNDYLKGDQQ